MTKYRLKDRDLQAKLDDLTNGAFSKNLHPYDETLFASYGDQEVVVEALPGKRKHREPKFGFWFTSDEVEAVPEYDPHGWNSWPGVEPPEDVLMRLEIDFGNGKAFHTAYFAETIFDGLKAWFECYGIGAPQGNEGLGYEDQMLDDLYEFDDNDQPFIRETVKSVRFRPWEDEE